MIATFIIDPPVLVALGLVFGALAPEVSPWRSRALAGGLVSAVVFTLIALVSYVVAPDWMWMYLLEPDDVGWAVPFIAVGYLACYALGYAAALALRTRGRAAVIGAIAASVVAEISLLAATWDRYHLVGTRSEWLRGTADELVTVAPEGAASLIAKLGPVFFAVLGVALVVAWKARRGTSVASAS